EAVFAVDRELVVFAHEDRADRTGFLTVTAENAPRLVNLVHRGVTRPGFHRPVVFGRFQIDRIRRAGHRTQSAGDALLQPVLIAHQDLFPAELREHRDLLLGVVDGDRFLEQVLESRGKTSNQRSNQSHCPQFTRPIRSSKSSMPASTQLPLWQVLVTTLVVKLAVIAALATMLV